MSRNFIVFKWYGSIWYGMGLFLHSTCYIISLSQVCNENGNCHCNPGWKCPNCSEAYDGPGGSIDNGLNCQALATTPGTTPGTTPPPPRVTTEIPVTTTVTEQSSDDKTLEKLLIPLVVVSLCFLIFLGIGICVGICCCIKKRRKNNNGQSSHKQGDQNNEFGKYYIHILTRPGWSRRG